MCKGGKIRVIFPTLGGCISETKRGRKSWFVPFDRSRQDL